ncbi:MAG: twin-arginine translocation signal domain-containing protein, partial [Gammaproteobacteria bacterium]|nr:twin-arginine translocation signal domain-containing protein [Gammaproteobacteria bacterium]
MKYRVWSWPGSPFPSVLGPGEYPVKRRNFLKVTGVGASALALTPAYASDQLKLSMTMSWIKNSPGTGATAARLAKRIEQLSGGKIKIKIYGAGELVSA